jgi:hypothetical protein
LSQLAFLICTHLLYFPKLGEEIFLEPPVDEAVMFKEFFAAGLQMPPHLILTDILVKFCVQLLQLTPNAFAQFSK